MATPIAGSYTEVYIWLGKDSEGYTTTSSEGWRLERREDRRGPERVGHASMQIFQPGQGKIPPNVYMSFWPDVVTRTKPGMLVKSLEVEQTDFEGTLPDVIIRLHGLDIPKMLAAFNQVKNRIEVQKTLRWKGDVSASEDVTDPNTRVASCVTFVYSFLRMGGLDNPLTYKNHVRGRGPRDWSFYNTTKCNAGDRAWGLFNGFPWTNWIFTPKALLLRTASAAERYASDINETKTIMGSDRVAVEKVQPSAALAPAGVLSFAVGALAVAKAATK